MKKILIKPAYKIGKMVVKSQIKNIGSNKRRISPIHAPKILYRVARIKARNKFLLN